MYDVSMILNVSKLKFVMVFERVVYLCVVSRILSMNTYSNVIRTPPPTHQTTQFVVNIVPCVMRVGVRAKGAVVFVSNY